MKLRLALTVWIALILVAACSGRPAPPPPPLATAPPQAAAPQTVAVPPAQPAVVTPSARPAATATAAPVPATPATAVPTGSAATAPAPATPAGAATAAATPAPTAAGPAALTARQLTAPNALMGPVPGSFNWAPSGAVLAYVESVDGQDVLWLYDAPAGRKRMLLDPSASPDSTIDVTTAQWSPQSDRLLVTGDTSLWLVDAKTGALQPLAAGDNPKTGLAFLPDGQRVSFVQNNDLYVAAIADGTVQRLTGDGSDAVLNGGLDWVYNEELATRAAQPAYAWSPDSNWLLYMRTDDSPVQNHPTTDYRPVPPSVSYTRFPAAGTANPMVSLHITSTQSGRAPQAVPLPAGAEYVLPWFVWTPDGREAMYATVNRSQSELQLLAWDPVAGKGRTVLKETDPHWINDDRYAAPVFLDNGQQFLWLSERDGFMHIYLYSLNGDLVRQVTQGNWMIDSTAWNLLTPGRPLHVDPQGTWAYFVGTRNGPLERQIYRAGVQDGQVGQLSQGAGFHAMALSGDGKYLVDQFSDVPTPPVTQVMGSDGTGASALSRSAGPSLSLPKVTRQFITVKGHDGVDLYAQLVKPENFDPNKKYGVVVHWYGGPGLQMVSNRYGSTNIFNIIERDVLYTQAGFLVWRLDNRGSFGRGHAFETPIEGQLGAAALNDQLAGLDYLRSLPYVDMNRIGTDGKSFGGYMTLYALIHQPDAFYCGVAGAPPTKWEYYDTIYTERYMHTPQQNPDGYAATDLVAAASQIRAQPLLIHGLNDRNVHLQNTVNFIEQLEASDKSFDFIPLPNLDHSFKGDGLVAALSSSTDYFQHCLGTR